MGLGGADVDLRFGGSMTAAHVRNSHTAAPHTTTAAQQQHVQEQTGQRHGIGGAQHRVARAGVAAALGAAHQQQRALPRCARHPAAQARNHGHQCQAMQAQRTRNGRHTAGGELPQRECLGRQGVDVEAVHHGLHHGRAASAAPTVTASMLGVLQRISV